MFSASSLALLGVIVRDYRLLPILALAIAVRLYGITYSSIWFDEAYSVLISTTAASSIWFHSAQDVHPPLYYFLLHLWIMFFGDSVFSVRAMSALTGVLTVPLCTWLVAVIATKRAAILTGFLTALLPMAVRYSQEARMYTLLALCCIGATLALVYWVKQSGRHRYLWAYALLMTAGFYTHYFAGPCLVAHWLYLLFVRDSNQVLVRRQVWWLANLAIVVLYLPWIPSLFGQLAHTNAVGWIPQVSGLSVVSQIWQFFALEPGSTWPLMAYLCTPLIAAVITWVLLKVDTGSYRFNLLIVLYTFAPILLVALVSLKVPLFWTRYFLFSAMGLPVLIALALDRLMGRNFRIGVFCLIAFVLVSAGGLHTVYAGAYKLNNPYQRHETGTDKVMNYLNMHWAAGDRILVYGHYIFPGVIYYNRTGVDALLYTPANGLEGRPDTCGAGSLWHHDADKIYVDDFEVIPAGTRRVWFIYDIDRTKFDVPEHWRSVSHFSFGDNQLWLYSVSPH